MKVFFLNSLLLVSLALDAAKSSAEDDSSSVEFPPILDADDIAYFSESHDIEGLHWALSNVFERSQRNIERMNIKRELPQSVIARGGGSTYCTAYKLKMDLEQAEYLATHLEDENKVDYFRKEVIPIYKSVLSRIPGLDELERTAGLYAFRKEDYNEGIDKVYNKALHVTDFDVLRDENGNVVPLLHPSLDIAEIEKEWSESDPQIVVVDNILSSRALQRIRQLLLESTVWYQTKMPLKFGGYVGAYIDDGLYDKLLLQLAFELNKALPRIMKNHALKYLWAYKYDSEYTGINTHADQAAVNVNLWVTPQEANEDDGSGGLVIFTAKPPADWDFYKFNTDTARVKSDILEPTHYHNVTVPYRENRAVIFDSALFHHTDQFHFKKGYENRRINLTILYGNMQRPNDGQKAEGATNRNDGTDAGIGAEL